MELYNKIKWILGILMVFTIILITNLVDRNNFKRVRDSVVTIYEDRLIASDLVFEMHKAIQNKERTLKVTDSTLFKSKNNIINYAIADLIVRFELTKLTEEEEVILKTFKLNFEELKDVELRIKQNNDFDNDMFEKQLGLMNKNLDALFKVQITEGRRQMSISQHALGIVQLFTQIEIYFLIFLAIAIQIIIIYQPRS
ncbi:MCP four helix bundle domain-containing protein [Gaetbulibacter sp. M240]|uniref:MCP four helix bundle domain-containing protein n=1 Tax=Gaetbulibacter sp. M240 TaxID=3126511 RepID=UPI00374F18FA